LLKYRFNIKNDSLKTHNLVKLINESNVLSDIYLALVILNYDYNQNFDLLNYHKVDEWYKKTKK